ncbi:viral A-type inclusion protein [Spirosoma sp.]|uniref:viral A-type inclusion protein n=1 Tax=Spirosoma sp. TaxID=1899569 RepID=UPI00260617D1|nr:viral A-type inclusion protein [Spirosoma sp.]MCX6215096.1 viral A-type inclusion protein [Spirosoma sp.]
MNQRFLAFAGLLIASGQFYACKSAEDTVKEAENEVFAIHDQIMPKIDDIMKLRKQLNQRIASLDSLKDNSSAATTLRTDEEREQASRIRTNLTIADSLMMDWMGRYNGDTLTKLSSDDALRYLNGQKEQITDVKTKVNTSIEQARQFLGKK